MNRLNLNIIYETYRESMKFICSGVGFLGLRNTRLENLAGSINFHVCIAVEMNTT